MTLGGMLEADRRLRLYEERTRLNRRMKNDDEVWKKWEGLLKEEQRLQKMQQSKRDQG